MKQTFSDTKNDEQINDLTKKYGNYFSFAFSFFRFFIKVSESVEKKLKITL